MPVTKVPLKAAGSPEGSMLGYVAKLVITCLVPALMALANGGRSMLFSWARVRSEAPGCTSVFSVTLPRPGKCLAVAATPVALFCWKPLTCWVVKLFTTPVRSL